MNQQSNSIWLVQFVVFAVDVRYPTIQQEEENEEYVTIRKFSNGETLWIPTQRSERRMNDIPNRHQKNSTF